MRFRMLSILGAAVLAAVSCGDSVTEKIDTARDPAPNSDFAPYAYPTGPDRYEGDDVAADAGRIRVGAAQWRTLYPVGDEDWVRIELAGETEYEFTTSHLSVNGDTWLYLYGGDGATILAEDDDCVGYDSCFRYTPSADGTYYLRVVSYDNQGLASYRLEARPFSDGDGDGASPFHDCNDADSAIHPWATDAMNDGIDQNCTGTDAIYSSADDPFEDDDTAETATPLVKPMGMQYEFIRRPEFFPGGIHTIQNPSDEDWFTVIIPPRQMVVVEVRYWNWPFDESGMQWVHIEVIGEGLRTMNPYGEHYTFVANDDDAPRQALVRAYYWAGAASYLLYAVPQGYDRDGDGYGTMGGWDEYDCDDMDPGVNDGAEDLAGDGIDRNCDGVDGVKPLPPDSVTLGREAAGMKRR